MKALLLAACRTLLAFIAAVSVLPASAKLAQSILWNVPTYAIATSTFWLPITANSGLPVTYTSATPEICSIGSDSSPPTPLVFLIKPGTCTFTGTAPGNNLFEPLSMTASVTVTWDVAVTMPQIVRVGQAISLDFSFYFGSAFGNWFCAADFGDPVPGNVTLGNTTFLFDRAVCWMPHTYWDAGFYTYFAAMSTPMGVASRSGEVVVVHPGSGRLSGSGAFKSPPGAFLRNPGLTGTFEFQIFSSYVSGTLVPLGELTLQLVGGSIPITVHSNMHYALVTSGPTATLIGAGWDHNDEAFNYELTFTQGPPDLVRLIAWDISGAVVYDTQLGAGRHATPITELSAGSIVVGF